jgi:hypothetical protein
MSALVTVVKAKKQGTFIERSLQEMTEEFEKYFIATEDVPWWYNERAVLGFFIAGLLRHKKSMVLQEFGCEKGLRGSKKGRADLWFQHNDETYLVESKMCFSAANTRSGFDEARQWANSVLRQAKRYREASEVDHVFSLCFEAIYCRMGKLQHFSQAMEENWLTMKAALKELDFYCVVRLSDEIMEQHSERYEYGEIYYPAVATYGLFG